METDKIYNIDCLVGMKEIPDKSVDWMPLKAAMAYTTFAKKVLSRKQTGWKCLRMAR